MTHAIEVRRKQLRFRSWHRGTKEADLILGRFADTYLDTFDNKQLDVYEWLLDQSDPEIYDWVTGRTPVPTVFDNDVTRLLASFKVSV